VLTQVINLFLINLTPEFLLGVYNTVWSISFIQDLDEWNHRIIESQKVLGWKGPLEVI